MQMCVNNLPELLHESGMAGSHESNAITLHHYTTYTKYTLSTL